MAISFLAFLLSQRRNYVFLCPGKNVQALPWVFSDRNSKLSLCFIYRADSSSATKFRIDYQAKNDLQLPKFKISFLFYLASKKMYYGPNLRLCIFAPEASAST